jgi:ribonucleoside-diphosphate reductase alpha chain
VSETAATKSLEVLKQISSTGYLRKRVPQELVVLQGGADPVTALETLVPEVKGGGTIAAATATTAITTG